MSSPIDSVGEDIMFSDCPSGAFVRPLVRTDLVTTIYLMNGLSNLGETQREQPLALMMTCLDSGCQLNFFLPDCLHRLLLGPFLLSYMVFVFSFRYYWPAYAQCGRARLVTVAGVCRRRLSASVTLAYAT